ncbi:hypothetical protein Barb6_00167 [Bacteroidales bacterium Barb6]|nr:hypothetical protein Barb6_00167 [Bacteroidales bacterium Barb6]
MKTKKQNEKQSQEASGDKQQEVYIPQRKLSALGEWFYNPDTKPLIKIIDMKAVLK